MNTLESDKLIRDIQKQEKIAYIQEKVETKVKKLSESFDVNNHENSEHDSESDNKYENQDTDSDQTSKS